MAHGADGTEARSRLVRIDVDMTTDTVRRHVVISGRVQGVFFRDSIHQRAATHGISGWVRNRPDGTVEAVFEGPRASVDELVRFSRTGPPLARVQDVEVREEEVAGEYGFRVW
jgi:acylphosphatase